jgi:hypothetical protein
VSLPVTGRDDQNEGDGSTVVVEANGASPRSTRGSAKAPKGASKEVIRPWEGPLPAPRTRRLNFPLGMS